MLRNEASKGRNRLFGRFTCALGRASFRMREASMLDIENRLNDAGNPPLSSLHFSPQP